MADLLTCFLGLPSRTWGSWSLPAAAAHASPGQPCLPPAQRTSRGDNTHEGGTIQSAQLTGQKAREGNLLSLALLHYFNPLSLV